MSLAAICHLLDSFGQSQGRLRQVPALKPTHSAASCVDDVLDFILQLGINLTVLIVLNTWQS